MLALFDGSGISHYLLDLMLIISPEILEEGTLDPANNLKAQGRPNLASSISLYVSDHG